MTASDIQHPHWCVPTASCRARQPGRHVTNPRVIHTPTATTVITARMWAAEQAADGSWVTFAELTLTTNGETTAEATLPVDQVRALNEWLLMFATETRWDRTLARRARTSGGES